MKKYYFISIFIVIIIECIFMVSCTNNKTSEESSRSQISSSTPIDELIEEEKVIFDSLLVNINDFFNPSEVRILEIGNYSENQPTELCPDGEKDCYIKINGTNRAGGTIIQVFKLVLMNYRVVYDGKTIYYEKGDLTEETSEINSKYNAVDIGRINKALKYYWNEKMGY